MIANKINQNQTNVCSEKHCVSSKEKNLSLSMFIMMTAVVFASLLHQGYNANICNTNKINAKKKNKKKCKQK